jgi:catechol-2,3-dioxygenase
VLTRFYSELRGWPILTQDDGGSMLDLGEGVAYLGIQHNPEYVRPDWPATEGRQQMMLHLDFEVADLGAAVAHALSLGAELPAHQPQDAVRILLDPAGHPFCLYT